MFKIASSAAHRKIVSEIKQLETCENVNIKRRSSEYETESFKEIPAYVSDSNVPKRFRNVSTSESVDPCRLGCSWLELEANQLFAKGCPRLVCLEANNSLRISPKPGG